MSHRGYESKSVTEESKLGSRDRELHDKGDDGNTAVMEMHIVIILWEWLEFWIADFLGLWS